MKPEKKPPQRMCVACRQMKDKSSLIRFVKTADGSVVLDKTNKLAGRGAYVCNDNACILKAIKTKALNRAFSTNIADEVYLNLKENIVE